MKQEEAVANALLALAEPRCGHWNTVIDGPLVDSRFSTPGPPQPSIGTPRRPAFSLDPQSPSRRTPPPTQRWPLSTLPLPPIEATSEHSPLSPLFSRQTPVRHSVPLADLVDEEGSSPGTRGGMRSFPLLATTGANMSLAQSYPPLSISIIDITPHFTGKEISETPEVPEVRSLQSSPLPPPEAPDAFMTPAPASPRSPLMSPARDDRCRAGGEGSKTPRRSERKGALLADPEAPDRRVTRSSSVKRVAADDFGIRAARPPKRARTSSP